MAETLVAPVSVEEAEPRPLRWTRAAYSRMAEFGLLPQDPGTELIDGVIYRKMSQGNAHILATKLIFRALLAAFGPDFDLSMQTTLPLGDSSAPDPDVLVLRGEPRDYDGRDPDPTTDVVLVVEVSDSTLATDRNAKVRLYAAHGVPKYWIVDLRHRTLEVRRRPYGEGYAETLVLSEGESVTIGNGTIAVADVLPKA